MQIETSNIKRRADGSIDTRHYMQIGRQMRADQAKSMVRSLKSQPESRPTSLSWIAILLGKRT